MPFDHLLDDATSAADAAEAAQIMAKATVTDDDATDEERADAQSILDLEFDELVARFSATQSGGRHEAAGSNASPPSGPVAPMTALAETSRAWSKASRSLNASLGAVYPKRTEALEAAGIYIVGDAMKGLTLTPGNFTIVPVAGVEGALATGVEEPDDSASEVSNIHWVPTHRQS